MNRPVLASKLAFNPIANHRSYWAMHFYSIIECMRFHNGLRYPSGNFRKEHPDWSLNDLRGHTPPNFFECIDSYMKNWGFQYFLVSFLNSYEMKPIAEKLIQRVGELYGVSFNPYMSDRKFHISGKDSDLSHKLDSLFVDVFPSSLLRQAPNRQQLRQQLINNTDICLILTDPRNPSQRVGIFGEVEGLHGEKLGRPGYWSQKNIYSIFAFGVVPEEGKGMYMETRLFNGVNRVLITFQARNSIVYDFRLILHWMHQLFNCGPYHRCECHDDLLDFIDIIKKNWFNPTSVLLHQLSNYISQEDVVESEPGPTPLIVSLQA